MLFSLVGWDLQEQPRLQDWLTGRLDRDYPALHGFGVDTARALIERGKILPILDGLDKVPATLRPGIITALNDAAFPANGGLILTSRRAEYAVAVALAGDVPRVSSSHFSTEVVHSGDEWQSCRSMTLSEHHKTN
ncbi:MAG: hypothetical protein ACRDTA_06380 [Pseudonocardiaceae bacterium]